MIDICVDVGVVSIEEGVVVVGNIDFKRAANKEQACEEKGEDVDSPGHRDKGSYLFNPLCVKAKAVISKIDITIAMAVGMMKKN